MKIVDEYSLREKIRVFKDRVEAAERLAEKLSEYKDAGDTVVLAIPSGGVPVGLTLARKLNLDFNLVMVRKIHLPWNQEVGLGAVSWDGTYLLNNELVELMELSPSVVSKCISNELNEIKLRMVEWGLEGYNLNVKDINVIITDDGLASGYTMAVAVDVVKKRRCRQLIVAVPTGSTEALRKIYDKVDRVICLNVRSSRIFAVADAYVEWRDITSTEVRKLLEEYRLSRR
ncbi:MAG: phosphoribosyltransferase family protein [Nitrososphaerota archaeon]